MRTFMLTATVMALCGGPVLAQDSAGHASAAFGGSSELAGHLTASGVQTVVGVSAVPASVVGAASVAGGSAVAATGSAVSEAAGASAEFASGPLKVDDRVVVSPDPAPAVPYDLQKPR